MIQIWCVLNAGVKDQGAISRVHEKSKKNSTSKPKATQPQKPRGRPRKNPIDGSAQTAPREVSAEQPQNTNCTEIISFDSVKPDKPIRSVREKGIKVSADNFDGSSQYPQPLPVEFPEASYCSSSKPEKPKGRPRNRRIKESVDNQYLKPCAMKSSENNLETEPNSCPIYGDVALPRLVMCLAHNGKVAWDVKWRPYDTSYVSLKHRMGYLAVLLGNGALEVWDVPHPRATKAIYSTCQKEGTDPRFVKLAPVFRCSMLRCGDRQSIPLTLEWSTSSPHDLILAGCHDGVVALWKFSATGPLKDTRPLLCFSADTVPIRALAWAPTASDSESANIIITAGHKGAKFWDIRDPFRPLWDVNVVQRIIYSLDWLPDPRCVVLSFDDGGIRIISLSNAASDVPVTAKPFSGTHQQGLRSYYCSSSPIWSVQVSRLTGMLAYCCSDGTTLCSQLTIKALVKDRRRNHEPHYLCGSLDTQGSTLTVFSPLPDVPFPINKSSNESKRHTGKGQMPEEKPLALCYGNDPGSDESQKSKDSPKQVFPPKMVAMHRVRWNMNKGSERWLCYGGAAGIVRCQEIR